MKKFTFVLMLMLAYAGFTMAQTIEDFESIKMNVFSAGATGSISVVPNPDPTGANTSLYVAKMVRGFAGADPWAGWYSTLPSAINLTDNRYIHIKLWKPRVSPTCFKVEGGAGDSGDTYPMTEYSNVGHWEEVVYDMTTSPNNPKPSGDYVKIVLIPDFLTPIGLTEDITIYYDDMYANNDPAVGSAPVQMIENFEIIPINPMLGGADDLSSFVLADNPDKTGVNISDHVLKFNRDMDGVPWGGFWSKVADYSSAVDVTTNKYVHAKVWKDRISSVKFKLEGGPDGNLEIESMAPQTKISAWEDMVFDFSSMSGAYPIIAYMPDFADPVGLTADATIYMDDIILNNDPNPTTPPVQIFQVDMNGSGITAADHLWISGSLGGIYGTWPTPGSNPNDELIDPDGDGIYTIYLSLPNQVVEFKFVKGDGWGAGEDTYGSNRSFPIVGNCNVIFTWGVGGFETSIRDNKQAGKIQMYPNPVRNELTVNTTSNISKVIITNTLGKVVGNTIYTNKTINTSNLSKGMYFVTFVNADGTKVTQKLVKD